MSRNYDITNQVRREGSTYHSHQSQDVTPTLLAIKAAKEKNGGHLAEGKFAAKIPMLLMYQWAKEDAGDQFAYIKGRQHKDPELAAKLAARLNSSEFQAFRVWEGKLSSSDMVKEGNKFAQ